MFSFLPSILHPSMIEDIITGILPRQVKARVHNVRIIHRNSTNRGRFLYRHAKWGLKITNREKRGTKEEERIAYKVIPLVPNPILSVLNSLLWMYQDLLRVCSSIFNANIYIYIYIYIYFLLSLRSYSLLLQNASCSQIISFERCSSNVFRKKIELHHSNEESCGTNKGAYSSSIPV